MAVLLPEVRYEETNGSSSVGVRGLRLTQVRHGFLQASRSAQASHFTLEDLSMRDFAAAGRAVSRAHAIKRSATELNVRFRSVAILTGQLEFGKSTGSTFSPKRSA